MERDGILRLACAAGALRFVLACSSSATATRTQGDDAGHDGAEGGGTADEGGTDDAGPGADVTSVAESGSSSDADTSGGFFPASFDAGPFVDPLDGAAGCDSSTAYAGPQCTFSIPFQGGLTGTLEAALPIQCGGGLSDAGTFRQLTFGTSNNRPLISLFLDFSSPISAGTIGAQYHAFATLNVVPHGGAGSEWATGSASCAVTLLGDECTRNGSLGALPYVLSATVNCSTALAPGAGTSAAPVTIGEFSFVTTVR